MAITNEFVEHLIQQGYHPRSSRHSDFLSVVIIRDLLDRCPVLKTKARAGEIVTQLHHRQMVGTDDWRIDIAIGTCADQPTPPAAPSAQNQPAIRFAPPVIIQIAIELKGVMTEHGKARRNRLRDFGAFIGHAQRYDPKTVTAAFLAVNSSDCFYSQLNLGKTSRSELTYHGGKSRTGRQTAKDVVDLYRAIYLRHSAEDRPGLDAIGVIAVEHDNILCHPEPSRYAHLHRQTVMAPSPPAPSAGDPLHYEAMLQRICNAYTARFASPGVAD
jgi:hypothetical protein